MKKIVLTTLVALLLASSSFAGGVIIFKLQIGKKSQPETCPAFGFCKFSISASWQDGFINGTMDVSDEKGVMIVGINESDILKVQPDKIIYFKGKQSVDFVEDFAMPAEINKAVKAVKPLVIRKGEYPMTYKNGVYFIEFPL
jgi:hypothetical protein